MSEIRSLQITIYPDEVTVYQLPCCVKLSPEIFTHPWCTISRTQDELSVTIPSSASFPSNYVDDKDRLSIKEEPGWRVLQVEGVLDFGLVGILAQVVTPLKDVNIPVFVISTYNTDYILVKSEKLVAAEEALAKNAIIVTHSNRSLMN